jgi:hypothetical protein
MAPGAQGLSARGIAAGRAVITQAQQLEAAALRDSSQIAILARLSSGHWAIFNADRILTAVVPDLGALARFLENHFR